MRYALGQSTHLLLWTLGEFGEVKDAAGGDACHSLTAPRYRRQLKDIVTEDEEG